MTDKDSNINEETVEEQTRRQGTEKEHDYEHEKERYHENEKDRNKIKRKTAIK